MKELSIEEKAKAYDEAKLRMSAAYNSNRCTIGFMNEIFPELKDSYGERTRKWLIEMVEEIRKANPTNSEHNGNCSDAIAWLEKQGEPMEINPTEFDTKLQALIGKFDSLPKEELIGSLSFWMNVVQNDGTYKPEEKQGEQKPADNEPKFHKDDWIVHHGTENIYQVVAIIGNQYQLKYGDNYTVQKYADVDRCARLWDITKDAKDGDVLASEDKDKVFIYNGKLDLRGRVCAYCGIYKTYDGLRFTECAIGNYFTYKEPHPATKEQRDQLEKAMADAGYIWDSKSKRLLSLKAGLNYTQNPAWSEEDEKMFNKIAVHLNATCSGFPEDEKWANEFLNWFKTLKERVQFQPRQEWSEEDKNMLQSILDEYKSMPTEKRNWLKFLKDRVHPKQEWKQENTGDLTDFENAMMHIGNSFFGQHAGLDPNDTNAIKEQANTLLGLVPSKEWSEEDKTVLNNLIYALANDRIGNNRDEYVDWLKSLRPQKRWNPSDEQITALEWQLKNISENSWQYKETKELLEQLKTIK